MSRSGIVRFAAAMLAVCFALAAVDGPALHPCPMHDAPVPGAAMPGMRGASMPDHAGTGETGRARTAVPRGHGHAPGHAHGCTCLGVCAGVQALPTPVAGASLPVPAPLALVSPAAPPPLDHGAVRHLHPFAHAPPAVLFAA